MPYEGNLRRHLNHHHPGYDRQGDGAHQAPQPGGAAAKKIQSQVKPAAVDSDQLNWLLLRWLIGASLPPSAMEDRALLASLRFLNPGVKLWSGERAQLTASEVFSSMRDDVRASLENLSSKVSIALEFWTSSEQIFYMSVKGHWIDESWCLRRVLLGVPCIPHPCGGAEILHALLKVLRMFGIEKNVLACTLDCSRDASQPAGHAGHALREELDARKAAFCYIPCAAQTLNLIIQDGLKTLRPTLTKIREFVREMNASPELAQDFRQLTAAYQEGAWQLPLDASPRWTGDYAMLDIARRVRRRPSALPVRLGSPVLTRSRPRRRRPARWRS